ncbi:nuclear transport factor 2 family protein [Yinghuangia seranimata]|uniref:nuclear transport factor 2 family protein n=1 Tax=Yinghuangia seranimata TaxID=408067 RepID=UPI00248CB927|nr:nuclear transport factor 2 family protein [Yinghuangia seranimata]MDI2131120.1 nuclear transport factor 2 family protein [Yinghuangia seranimata]
MSTTPHAHPESAADNANTAPAGTRSTAEVIDLFNAAFTKRAPELLDDLVHEDCVMVSVQPAPEGTRYEGLDACLGFWRALALDLNTTFTPTDVYVFGDRAVIKWRVAFQPGEVNEVFGDAHADSVWMLGVNLMEIRDGRIVEALGYGKTP